MELLYTLQDLLPVLGELRNALSMRKELEKIVDAGNFCKVEFSIDVTALCCSQMTMFSFSLSFYVTTFQTAVLSGHLF